MLGDMVGCEELSDEDEQLVQEMLSVACRFWSGKRVKPSQAGMVINKLTYLMTKNAKSFSVISDHHGRVIYNCIADSPEELAEAINELANLISKATRGPTVIH